MSKCGYFLDTLDIVPGSLYLPRSRVRGTQAAGAMRSGGGGGDDEDSVPLGSVGPVRRRLYESNAGKHGRVDHGYVSREPKNGQDALDCSVPIKTSVPARVGIDYEEGMFVVLRRHLRVFQELPEVEIFHGYVVEWSLLPQECRNALMKAGMANLKGMIL